MSVPRLARPIPVATAIGAAAARAARDPGRVVRVAGLRARHAERELVRRGLAEDHGAGGAPERDGVGVVARQRLVGGAAAARADAADVDDVLDRDRDAVQRAAPVAGAQLGVAGARLGAGGLGGDLDERRPLVAGDPRPAPARRARATSSRRRRAAGGTGDGAGRGSPPSAGSGAGGGPKTSIGRPPFRRVDGLRAHRSRAAANAVVAMLFMAVPPRTSAPATRRRAARRPPRCARCAPASARRPHRAARRGRSRGSPGAPRSSPRSGPAS